MTEDLIDKIGESIINRAMERVIHRFEYSSKEDSGVGVKCAIDMKSAAALGPINSPCALLIKAQTKQGYRTAISQLNSVITALDHSGLISQDRIREFYFSRLSSFEEMVEVYVIALDD